MSEDLNLLDQFEIGGTFFELIEFSLVRHLNDGRTITGIYGVNVAKVREVVHMPKINPLASRVPGVAGIFELRGVPIPAINLCRILGDANAPLSDLQQIVVTEFSGKRAGFVVSTTHRIRRVAWEKVLPPSSDHGSCMSGMILIEENKFLFILDLEKILGLIESRASDSGPTHSPYSMNSGAPNSVLNESLLDGSSSGNRGVFDLNAPGILFADDSKIVLNNVTKSLQASGYRVMTANNGLDAWEKLNSLASNPDLAFGSINCLVSDVEMPLMDGITLVKKVREDGRFNDLPIILHSSLSGAVTSKTATQAGANAYVVKSDVRNLVESLKELLEKMPYSIGA